MFFKFKRTVFGVIFEEKKSYCPRVTLYKYTIKKSVLPRKSQIRGSYAQSNLGHPLNYLN